MRMITASGCTARIIAGASVIFKLPHRSWNGETHVSGGVHLNTLELISRNIVASQKPGNESPISPMIRVTTSVAELRLTAERIPSGIASKHENTIAMKDRKS